MMWFLSVDQRRDFTVMTGLILGMSYEMARAIWPFLPDIL